MNEIPRISVTIITYNQEDVIHRVLDSVLSQGEGLYEICVNDDCSTDRTWDVLQEYAAKYPCIVKPVRNAHNLGIFQNNEAVWSRPVGDLVFDIAGDDECAEGFFERVIDFIRRNNIDWKNELFCIYGDYKMINADGRSVVYRQNLVNHHNALKLKTRKLLSTRSACFSRKVLEKFETVSDGRSYNAEMVQDCQLQLFSERNYYIPVVGSIYYAQIGISSRMSEEEMKESVVGAYDRYISFLADHGKPLDKKDLAFIEYMEAYRRHDVRNMLRNYFRSIDLSLGLEGLQLRRIAFVLRSKLFKKL